MDGTILILVFSVVFNAVIKMVTPFLGRYRSGIDSMIFCAILSGYAFGARTGFAYGVIVAIFFYVMNVKQLNYGIFVIPLTGVMGLLSGLMSFLPLPSLTILILVVYHIVSAAIFLALVKNAGFGYFLFIPLSFATTLMLIGTMSPFFI
jgi:hypothetical protein